MPLEDAALEPRIRTRPLAGVDRAIGASVIAAVEPVLIRLALIAFLIVLAFLMLCGLVLGPVIRRIRRPNWKRVSQQSVAEVPRPTALRPTT